MQDSSTQQHKNANEDNASNNMGAAKLLKEKRPTIFWTSCATHTLNLMLEGIGGLSRYNKILTQAKALTVFIYAHHKTLALMRHFTKKRDIVRPGVTRFASAFLTLQSLADKKAQLKQMFTSDEWEACKFRKSAKGKVAHSTVMNIPFWTGVALCLKVFTPLVKVLRMVDADRKPSMGFIYGEIESAKQEIMNVLGNKEKYYQPVLDIISKKMKVYKSKQEKFSREMATKGCLVNDDNFDPANWWGAYGASTPELTKIAIRILSLTTSSSGCERNWSTFEGVHTKKRNRLETNKLNNLVFVQFNANLMQMNKKRKTKGMEVLLANDASEAQDWIVEGDVEEAQPEVPSAASINGESLENRRSSRLRELEEEDFVSENEEELSDEVEYESDGVNINEQYGDPLENILEEDD
ncbi:putative HAT dimerization domain, ribonuclease H-like superfamily [Helianthus annuus]|nr:putative HAT dimerization domain, ribonuclease H-like superfamily [Helianthus annuus]